MFLFHDTYSDDTHLYRYFYLCSRCILPNLGICYPQSGLCSWICEECCISRNLAWHHGLSCLWNRHRLNKAIMLGRFWGRLSSCLCRPIRCGHRSKYLCLLWGRSSIHLDRSLPWDLITTLDLIFSPWKMNLDTNRFYWHSTKIHFHRWCYFSTVQYRYSFLCWA